MQKFEIDKAIRAAARPLGSLKLSDALLMDDGRFPWIVLVPRRVGARELEHLSSGDRAFLIEEMVAVSAAVRAVGAGTGRPVAKINIGALGNITPQLHVHVVGRREDDPCWPGPVWGCGEAQPMDPDAARLAAEIARHSLGLG